MGSTINSNNSSVHSVQSPSTSATEEPKQTKIKASESNSAVESPAQKKAAEHQGKEAAAIQDLSGKMRSQDLNEQLKQANPQTDPNVRSTVLTPEKEARIKYQKLDKQIKDLSEKILDLQKEKDKAPKKAQEAMQKQIDKKMDKLGELILEQEHVAKKLPIDPKIEERIFKANHDIALSTMRHMR